MERANTPTNGLAACFVAAEPECGRSAQRKALFDISVISGRWGMWPPNAAPPMVQAWKLELMAREIYKSVWQDHRQDILEEYQQEQENGAANSEKVEEALSWQESFPNDEISREFLDRFVPRIFSIDGQKFIWELNLFQESSTVQCNDARNDTITIRFRRKKSCREKQKRGKGMGPSIGYLRMQTVRAFGYIPMMTTQ